MTIIRGSIIVLHIYKLCQGLWTLPEEMACGPTWLDMSPKVHRLFLIQRFIPHFAKHSAEPTAAPIPTKGMPLERPATLPLILKAAATISGGRLKCPFRTSCVTGSSELRADTSVALVQLGTDGSSESGHDRFHLIMYPYFASS